MLKKIIMPLIIAAAIGLFVTVPGTALAQFDMNMADIEAAFAKEPPLTQADINAFIKIGPDMIKAATANNTAQAAALLKEAGWTEARGSYVTAKISNAYAMNMNPEIAKSLLESAGMPSFLLPTTQEMELVKRNLSALDAIFGAGGAF